MEERETWDLFFYQQIKRVPGMIASLEATRSFADRYKDILAGFEAKLGRPLTKAELDEFNSPEFKARVRQNAIVKALADDGKVVQTMLSVLPLRLGVSKSAMPFLVARRPVARVDGAQGQIFAYQNVALWLPIAPRVVVGPGVVGIREQLVELHDEEVLAINNALAEQSDIIASADLNLLKRYVSR